MTKFIFGLSFMVVVLTIGCFTFPLDESTTSTDPSLATQSLLTNKVDLEAPNLTPKLAKPVPRKPGVFSESESSESFTSTHIVPFHVRDVPDLSLTSAEVTTELINHHLRSLPVENEKENENESESESDKREVLELTTSYMPSFTSTSVDVAPNYYISESSTQKYVGRLEESSEEGSESIKFKKLPKSKVELTTETNFPTLILDQNPGDRYKYTSGEIMRLEENTTAVTSIPEKLETTTIKKPIENSSEEELKTTLKPKIEHKHEREDPLNQGKEPSLTEAS